MMPLNVISSVIDFLFKEYSGLVILMVAFILAWIIAKFYYKRFVVTEERAKKFHDKSDCENHQNQIERLKLTAKKFEIDSDCGKHKELFDKIGGSIDAIMNDMNLIKSVIVPKHPHLGLLFSEKRSPRQLNENGRMLFSLLKGENFLNENKDTLFDLIDAVNPPTALDVELAAYEVFYKIIDEPILKSIKDFIYSSPSITIKGLDGEDNSYDMNLNDTFFILSLPLRDMYLAEHPAIKPEE